MISSFTLLKANLNFLILPIFLLFNQLLNLLIIKIKSYPDFPFQLAQYTHHFFFTRQPSILNQIVDKLLKPLTMVYEMTHSFCKILIFSIFIITFRKKWLKSFEW